MRAGSSWPAHARRRGTGRRRWGTHVGSGRRAEPPIAARPTAGPARPDWVAGQAGAAGRAMPHCAIQETAVGATGASPPPLAPCTHLSDTQEALQVGLGSAQPRCTLLGRVVSATARPASGWGCQLSSGACWGLGTDQGAGKQAPCLQTRRWPCPRLVPRGNRPASQYTQGWAVSQAQIDQGWGLEALDIGSGPQLLQRPITPVLHVGGGCLVAAGQDSLCGRGQCMCAAIVQRSHEAIKRAARVYRPPPPAHPPPAAMD